MTDIIIMKPFLKWVGGKTQIIDNILLKIPGEIYNYHEPFLGGGSVLLGVLSLNKKTQFIKGDIYAYDYNKNLINVYNCIQTNPNELYNQLKIYIDEYSNISGEIINRNPLNIDDAKTSKESYYYWIRRKYNTSEDNIIDKSAMFMFINKTCFRGLYREGPNGYNVPFGHYKNTTFLKKDEMIEISVFIKNVKFIHSDFKDSLKIPKKEDFVYLDPPYAPETNKSFVGYTKSGFNLNMHQNLFDEISKLNKIGVNFLMSNSNVSLVTEYFKDYNCEELVARRSINSKNPGSTTTEVLIYN